MDFRFITNMILLTTYSASSKFNKMLVKSAAMQTFVMLVVFLLVCLLVLQPVEVQAGIASDFSSKGSRNVNSVMTKSGRALYQTKLVDIPIQFDYDLTLRFKWEPSRPNVDSPIGTEWVVLAFDSTITEEGDKLWVKFPGGRYRLLKKIDDQEFRRTKGNFVAKRGKLKGDFTLTCDDRWILTYKKGRLSKVEIPQAGQKTGRDIKDEDIVRTTYNWLMPWESKDGTGGIYNETTMKWVMNFDIFPSAPADKPSATITWADGERQLSLYTTSGEALGDYFPSGVMRKKGKNLTRLMLNDLLLEKYTYKVATPEASKLAPKQGQRLLRFDHLVANDVNNYAVFDAKTGEIRRDAQYRYYFKKKKMEPYPAILKIDNLNHKSYYEKNNGLETNIDALGQATVKQLFKTGPLMGKTRKVTRYLGAKINLNKNNGQVTHQLGDNKLVTEQHYYSQTLRKKIRSIDRFGNATIYKYKKHIGTDKVSEQITIEPGGASTVKTYNIDGKVTEEVGPLGGVTKHSYDQQGNRISTTTALGHSTTFEYDDNNRLIKTNFPDGSSSSSAYDKYDNLIKKIDEAGSQTLYSYNTLDERISMTDALGNVTKYRYDNSEGACVSCGGVRKPSDITYPNGRIDKTIYEPFTGAVQATIIAAGSPQQRKSINLFDAAYRIIATIDPTGKKSSYQLDALGRRVAVTDPLGNTTKTSYHPNGKVIAITHPDGLKDSYQYNTHDQLTKHTDRAGRTTKYYYDKSGNRSQLNRPSGVSEFFGHSKANHLITHNIIYDDNMVDATTYHRDLTGRPIKITHRPVALDGEDTGIKRVETRVYDKEGKLLTRTLPTGETITHAYDSRNRRIKTVRTSPAHGDTPAREAITTFTYGKTGRLSSHTTHLPELQLPATTTMSHDPLGRTLTTTRAKGTDQESSQALSYDAMGNVVSTTDGLGHKASHAYDILGQRTKTTDPLGNTTSYEYGPLGNVVRIIDPLQGITQRAFDALGRLTLETDPEQRTTAYLYDGMNRLAGYRNPAGQEFRFSYDALGRRTSRTEPDGTSQSYQYDLAGRLVSRTKADGAIISYQYRMDGKLISHQWQDAPETKVSYQYDELGRMTDIDTAQHKLSYSYDALGNKISETQHWKDLKHQATVSYTHTSDRRPLTLSHNDQTLHYSWAGAGQLASVKHGERSYHYKYDKAGRRSTLTRPSGISDHYHRDASGRLSSIGTTDKHGKTITFREFDYDAAGRLTSKTNPDGTTTRYGYDKSGQVIAAQLDIKDPAQTAIQPANAQYRYSYDTAGNRKETVINQKRTQYQATPVNQYSAIDGKKLEYDKNGNLLKAEGSTYRWNHDNRLISHTNTKGSAAEGSQGKPSTVSYSYDPLGRRISKVTHSAGEGVEAKPAAGVKASTTTLYQYDGWNVVATFQSNSSPFTLHSLKLWGTDLSGSLQGAGGVGGLLAEGKVAK